MLLATTGSVLALVLLAASPPKPLYGPGPAFNAGPIADSAYAFVFDLPEGLRAEHAPDMPEYWIGPVPAGITFTLRVEAYALPLAKPKSDPHQYLLAYAHRYMALQCDYLGDDRSGWVDSLIAPRDFRTNGGLPALEYLVRIREEIFGGGEDFDEGDSSAVIDSSTSASRSEPDWVSHTEVVRVAGPVFLIDIGRPGHPAVVRVEFNCDSRPDPETLRLGRAIVMSVRLSGARMRDTPRVRP